MSCLTILSVFLSPLHIFSSPVSWALWGTTPVWDRSPSHGQVSTQCSPPLHNGTCCMLCFSLFGFCVCACVFGCVFDSCEEIKRWTVVRGRGLNEDKWLAVLMQGGGGRVLSAERRGARRRIRWMDVVQDLLMSYSWWVMNAPFPSVARAASLERGVREERSILCPVVCLTLHYAWGLRRNSLQESTYCCGQCSAKSRARSFFKIKIECVYFDFLTKPFSFSTVR